jgi:hypothetical protein
LWRTALRLASTSNVCVMSMARSPKDLSNDKTVLAAQELRRNCPAGFQLNLPEPLRSSPTR